MVQLARTVFCVSDHTGVTAEAFAHSLISRFEEVDASYVLRPFTDNMQKLEDVIDEINQVSERGGPRPIVCSTITNDNARARLRSVDALVLSLFDEFISNITDELGVEPTRAVGAYHGIRDLGKYQTRLDAVDFALATDDGLGTKLYPEADIILVGVSRAGKTPSCLYLSMQHGVKASNYPLTMDDLEGIELPDVLRAHQGRIFGLTIDPVRLHQIRQKRRPDSTYASLSRCTDEVSRAERLFRQLNIPFTDTTTLSIEEITATVLEAGELRSRLN